jgi:broad specificity phosphatase PhoE
MTTLYIVRHGQYATPKGIIPYRLPGFHLAPEGVAQAQALAKRLSSEPIVAIYTSPLERTQETAQILGVPHHLIPVVDDRLIETRSPAQGMTPAEIAKHGADDWSGFDSAWYKENNAEHHKI